MVTVFRMEYADDYFLLTCQIITICSCSCIGGEITTINKHLHVM